jgi:hypothetical protein
MYYNKNTEALVVAGKENGLEGSADKLSTRPGLEIRMQDEVTKYRLRIAPLKGWKSLNIW